MISRIQGSTAAGNAAAGARPLALDPVQAHQGRLPANVLELL